MAIRKDKVEETLKSPLLNKKITIALVKRVQSSLYKDPDLSTLATGGSKSFTCPLNKDTGYIVDPLTKEERDYLEEALGIDLNVHKQKDNFWTTKKAKCILRKTGRKASSANIVLDLSNPIQYILYKIALVNPRVASKWAERYDRKEYEFVIIDGDVELQDELAFGKKERLVRSYLIENEHSKKKLFDLLRMYGTTYASKQVSADSSAEWLLNELEKAARRPSEIDKLYTLIKLGEREISDKVFLADCVSSGIIQKSGYDYRLVGGDKIGSNEIEAIAWLNDKTNNSTRARFEQMVEEFFKEK